MATEYVEQIVREAPDIEAYKVGLLQSARDLSQRGLNLPAYQVAQLSPTQRQAAQLAQSGLGAYQPYLQAAGMGIAQGQNLAQTGAEGIASINVNPEFMAAQQAMQSGLSAAGQLPAYAQVAGQGYGQIASGAQTLGQAAQQAPQYNQANLAEAQRILTQGTQLGAAPTVTSAPTVSSNVVSPSMMTTAQAGGPERVSTGTMTAPGTIEQYMSPYMQNVLAQQMQEINRQDAIAAQSRSAQAVRAGAFGGTREGVMQSEAARNLADLKAKVMAEGLQTAYGQGVQQFNVEQQASLAGQQANQQATLQTTLANLSADQQARVQNQAAALQAAGMNQQTALQAALANQQTEMQRSLANQQMQGQYGLTGAQLAANVGQTLGTQQLQQSQLGQSGVQLQGQLGAQQAQLGLLPAQLASQQAAIAGQGAQLYGSLGQGIGALGAQRAGVQYQSGMGIGQLGSTIGQLGIQQAALGQARQQLGAADVSMLSQLGAIEQQNLQQQLDAARATQLQQTMSPYQQVAFLSDIYKGAPSSQMTLSAQTAPSTSPLAQAVGLGISGLSAAGAASKLF